MKTPGKMLFTFCLLMLAARIIITGEGRFVFLLWNLFLAWIPFQVIMSYRPEQSRWIRIMKILVTVAFLPNAPYIVTDLFHLSRNSSAPQWFDLLLLCSFAILGMAYFLRAAGRLLAVGNSLYRYRHAKLVIKGLMMLSSGYGVYLGRYLRFNSWDVLTDPLQLLHGILSSVSGTEALLQTAGCSVCFGFFLYIIYELCTQLPVASDEELPV